MKEYDEEEALSMMSEAVAPDLRDTDAIAEVLDLIYDYYDENGGLEIDVDSDDEEDVDDMSMYVMRYLENNPPRVSFTVDDVAALIRAEINYEQSLL
ncbi:MAG: hypothetical protein OSJ37_00310 [Muribaculaceae bacterium]|jgi:hypothetical protein|nr:hypothetical protein [Muribaculaceae bacterium]